MATGLVSTRASEYCFCRWISRNSPALWMASPDWVANVWSMATTSGENAPRSRRRMTSPPSRRSSRTSGTARSERSPCWVRRRWTWGATRRAAASTSATSTGARSTPARPMAPSPSRIGAARTASRNADGIWWATRAWKLSLDSSNS